VAAINQPTGGRMSNTEINIVSAALTIVVIAAGAAAGYAAYRFMMWFSQFAPW